MRGGWLRGPSNSRCDGAGRGSPGRVSPLRLPRFALHPGEVRSPHDGDLHWVSAQRLAELYGLKPAEWRAWGPGLQWEDYIHLWPRADGHYEVKR